MNRLIITILFFALFAITNEASAATYEEKEDNGDVRFLNEAYPVNATYTGVLGSEYDKDYYKITVPEDGELEFSFSNVPYSKFKIELLKQSSNGNFFTIAEMYSDNSKKPEPFKTIKVGLKKGEFVISVDDEQAAAFEPYTIKTTFKANDKIEYQGVYPSSIGARYKEIQLNTVYTGRTQNLQLDEDYPVDHEAFVFTINEPMTISVNVVAEVENSYGLRIKYLGEDHSFSKKFNSKERVVNIHKAVRSDLPKSFTHEIKLDYPGQYELVYDAGYDCCYKNLVLKDSNYKIIVKNKLALNFTDVTLSHPYYTEIMTAASKGIINGYPTGKFEPNTLITREQLVNMLARTTIDFTSVRDAVMFTDVPKTYRNYANIQKLYQAGVIDGNLKNRKFYPTESITRAELAMILVKAFKLEQQASTIAFLDVSKSDPAYTYIQTLASHGITTGDGKGNFNPKQKVSRQHFTLFMMRIMENTK